MQTEEDTKTRRRRDAAFYEVQEGASERIKNRRKRHVDRGRNTIDTNPCFHEGERSLQCRVNRIEDCSQYYENYKKCRTFWNQVTKDRKKKGIEPHLPVPEDRAAVREEYLQSFINS